MRSATTDSRNAQNDPHRNNHSLQNTEEEPKRPQPHPPHTQGTFHRRPQPQKNTRFRAPASSPKQSPCNIHAAITLRFAASRHKPARIYAHGNTRWQQSCSHSNAFCNHRFKKRTELPTQEQPLVAEHRGGTKTTPAAPAAHTRYLSSPATATYTEKQQVSCSGFLPKTKPHATFMQPLLITLRFAGSRRKPARVYAHGNTVIWLCVRVPMDCPCARVPVCPCACGFLVRPCAHGSAACPCARRAVRRPISPAIATSHGKTQGFVPWLPPQNKVHARFMQPLHCVSQHHVANLHVSLHMATPDDNNHAAITGGYCYVMSSPTPQSHPSLSVFLCGVKSHTTVSHQSSLGVFLCDVKSHTTVSHRPSLSVLLCDVKSHTTRHWAYFYVMWSLTPQSHTALHWVYCYVMWSLTPQSHTTRHWVYCYVMWSLTPQSHTTLHWVYYVM